MHDIKNSTHENFNRLKKRGVTHALLYTALLENVAQSKFKARLSALHRHTNYIYRRQVAHTIIFSLFADCNNFVHEPANKYWKVCGGTEKSHERSSNYTRRHCNLSLSYVDNFRVRLLSIVRIQTCCCEVLLTIECCYVSVTTRHQRRRTEF
jgi:hypothetical protein